MALRADEWAWGWWKAKTEPARPLTFTLWWSMRLGLTPTPLKREGFRLVAVAAFIPMAPGERAWHWLGRWRPVSNRPWALALSILFQLSKRTYGSHEWQRSLRLELNRFEIIKIHFLDITQLTHLKILYCFDWQIYHSIAQIHFISTGTIHSICCCCVVIIFLFQNLYFFLFLWMYIVQVYSWLLLVLIWLWEASSSLVVF